MKINQNIMILFFLLLATSFEVCGDALVRKIIYEYTGTYRIVCILISAMLLFGYGFALNLAPVDFGKVVGMYIATLFIVWQVINYFTFGTAPSLSVIIGGLMIITGGLLVTFAKF